MQWVVSPSARKSGQSREMRPCSARPARPPRSRRGPHPAAGRPPRHRCAGPWARGARRTGRRRAAWRPRACRPRTVARRARTVQRPGAGGSCRSGRCNPPPAGARRGARGPPARWRPTIFTYPVQRHTWLLSASAIWRASGGRVPADQVLRRDDDARDAETALQAPVTAKAAGEDVPLARVESFERDERASRRPVGRGARRRKAPAVDEHGAAAARTLGSAAVLGGEMRPACSRSTSISDMPSSTCAVNGLPLSVNAISCVGCPVSRVTPPMPALTKFNPRSAQQRTQKEAQSHVGAQIDDSRGWGLRTRVSVNALSRRQNLMGMPIHDHDGSTGVELRLVRARNVRQRERALGHPAAQHERAVLLREHEAGEGAARRHESRLPKNRGFSICGPPVFGAETRRSCRSRCHPSAKIAICVGFNARYSCRPASCQPAAVRRHDRHLAEIRLDLNLEDRVVRARRDALGAGQAVPEPEVRCRAFGAASGSEVRRLPLVGQGPLSRSALVLWIIARARAVAAGNRPQGAHSCPSEDELRIVCAPDACNPLLQIDEVPGAGRSRPRGRRSVHVVTGTSPRHAVARVLRITPAANENLQIGPNSRATAGQGGMKRVHGCPDRYCTRSFRNVPVFSTSQGVAALHAPVTRAGVAGPAAGDDVRGLGQTAGRTAYTPGSRPRRCSEARRAGCSRRGPRRASAD